MALGFPDEKAFSAFYCDPIRLGVTIVNASCRLRIAQLFLCMLLPACYVGCNAKEAPSTLSTESAPAVVPQLTVGTLPPSATAGIATRVDVPAEPARSVVAVVTEFKGKAIAAETGFIFHCDNDVALMVVDARPVSVPKLRGIALELTYSALVADGKNERRMALTNSLEMSHGRTLFALKSSDFPAPLPRNSDVVIKEDMTLLLVGCEVGFVDDKAVPKIIAAPVKVDRTFRDPNLWGTLYTVASDGPLNLQAGVLTTTDGRVVARAVVDPKRPRSTSGFRYFISRPLAELERVGDPEPAFLRANFKIVDGTAHAEFAMYADDPFSRLKNPRLFVSTAIRSGWSSRLSSLVSRPSKVIAYEIPDAARVTVRDGRWIDRRPDGFEVVLSPAASIDPKFGSLPPSIFPKRGSFYFGSCTFPVKEPFPFTAQCVVDDLDGRMTAFGSPTCLYLNSELEAFGCNLLKSRVPPRVD